MSDFSKQCFYCKTTKPESGFVILRYRADFVYVCTSCDQQKRHGKCSVGVRDTKKWGDYRTLTAECPTDAIHQDPPCCGDHCVCEHCGAEIGGCYHEQHPSYVPFEERICLECEQLFDDDCEPPPLW